MSIKGFGYLPDLPSILDITPQTKDVPSKRLRAAGQPPVKEMLKNIGVDKVIPDVSAASDLRKWATPIEDQGPIGSCVLNGYAGLVEYFENRAFGSYVEASRLFMYKNARILAGLTGDSGTYIRSAMEAAAAFGAPPEKYHPYDTASFDREPSQFAYAYGQAFKALTYYRLDPPGVSPLQLLQRIKTNLAAGLPSIFGFTVYSSISQADTNGGKIPFPTRRDRVSGGHGIDVFGHDDNIEIRNSAAGSTPTIGAFLIRNSWGTGWGEAGYGWLPYEYVLRGLADDWWSLLKSDWVDAGVFSLNE